MPLTARENYLRAARFESPEWIPLRVNLNNAMWDHHPAEALLELMESHPLLFPDATPGMKPPVRNFGGRQRAGQPYTDGWGCVWETSMSGIIGAVIEHPLADWQQFSGYAAPDPEQTDGHDPIDWNKKAQAFQRLREKGRPVQGELRHGHTFLQLTDIRGYENAIFDMTDDDPRLHELLAMIEEFNLAIVRRYLQLGIDVMRYPEDLGMQVGPMLSPPQFRKYIKPSYQRLIAPAREAGCAIHMHSDGDIRTLLKDILEAGVEIINVQDLVNGIDWLRENAAGKVCIDLDIDRQNITVHGTPREIDELVRREVEELGSKQGGLMLNYGCYVGTPLENAKAVMDAMERYAGYYS